MNHTCRKLIAAAMATGLIAAMTGCATNSPTPEGTDEISGTIYWYSGYNPAKNDAAVAAFNDLHPEVNIEVLRAVTGDLTVRYAQERASNSQTADIISQTNPLFIEDGAEKGWWDTDVMPAEGWPDEEFDDGVALTTYIPQEMGYNSDLVSTDDAPQSWQNLTDPQYKDRLVLIDPRSDPAYLSLLQLWSQEYGDEFIESLASQAPRWVPSNVPGTEVLGSGAADVMAPNSRVAWFTASEAGAPIELATPLPTTAVEFYTTVSEGAQNPRAAAAFYEFLTTKEGQEALNENVSVSPRSDTEGTAPMPEDLVPLMDLLPTATERRDELLDLIGVQ